MSNRYSTGTINVSGANGTTLSFFPKTKASNVKDVKSGKSVLEILDGISQQIESSSESSGIKVMYEEPSVINTEAFKNKTLIGTVVPPIDEGKTIQVDAWIPTIPENALFFDSGEPYEIKYELFNNGSSQATSISFKQDSEGPTTATVDVLEAGEALTLSVPMTVSKEDVVYAIQNQHPKTTTTLLEMDNQEQWTIVGNLDTTLNCVADDISHYAPSLTIFVAEANTPADESIGWTPGETIQLTTTVRNDSNAYFNEPISITCSCTNKGVAGSQTQIVNPRESYSFSSSVAITEQDIIDRNGWCASASAVGTTFLGDLASSTTTNNNIQIAPSSAKLLVQYIATTSPHNGIKWNENETIEYDIIATNIGTRTISSIQIEDKNSGQDETIVSLAPKASVTLHNSSFTYTIPTGNDEPVFIFSADISAEAPSGLQTEIEVKDLIAFTSVSEDLIMTIDTNGYYSNNVTGIPFIPESDSIMIVNWGDGNESVLDSSSAESARSHTYSDSGIYTITVVSSDWENVQFEISSTLYGGSPLYYFKYTVTSFLTPLPKMSNSSLENGFSNCENLTSIPVGFLSNWTHSTSFAKCFQSCRRLVSIPANLFRGCSNATSFSNCFSGCSSIASNGLPSSTFAGCTGAISFDYCFYGCEQLEIVPEHLFDDCTSTENFHCLFKACYDLKIIPSELFKYNILATDMGGMFWNCRNLQYIDENLLKYNTALINVGAFFSGASGPGLMNLPVNLLKYNINVETLTTDGNGFFEGSEISSFSLRIGSSVVTNVSWFDSTYGGNGKRTVYVPANSTTYDTFVAYAANRTNFNIVAE